MTNSFEGYPNKPINHKLVAFHDVNLICIWLTSDIKQIDMYSHTCNLI